MSLNGQQGFKIQILRDDMALDYIVIVGMIK